MIAYLDASVILRRVLNQPGPEIDWSPIEGTITSSLAEVECFRALDRIRLSGNVDEIRLALAREHIYAALKSCDVLEVGQNVLDRAGAPFPIGIKTLDAIHLATAMIYRDYSGNPILMATHDRALARASRAMGLEVVGAA